MFDFAPSVSGCSGQVRAVRPNLQSPLTPWLGKRVLGIVLTLVLLLNSAIDLNDSEMYVQ